MIVINGNLNILSICVHFSVKDEGGGKNREGKAKRAACYWCGLILYPCTVIMLCWLELWMAKVNKRNFAGWDNRNSEDSVGKKKRPTSCHLAGVYLFALSNYMLFWNWEELDIFCPHRKLLPEAIVWTDASVRSWCRFIDWNKPIVLETR